MLAYIVKRLLLMIPTLLGVLLLTFAVIQFVPGGPVEQYLAEAKAGAGGAGAETGGLSYRGAQGVDPKRLEAIKALYGFDKPAHERFVQMLGQFARFDLGKSFFQNKAVTDLILEKLPVSISLGLWTFFISYLVAVPLGLALAIYLSEYASGAARARIKGTLELFEGIPTVVFGYFALLFVTPLLQRVIPDLNIFNPLSAGLVMGFAIIPYISNVAADAMESVPRSIREAAYALGARPYEVALRVVFPAAISGIIAAIILATSRAIGETMIVAIAAGQRPILTLDPRETIATMTSYIVQAATGDQPTGSTAYYALFAVGFTLFLLTLFLNILAQYVVERYRERYE